MGTRSNIGILYADGSVETIYCHWDGYFENNGLILYENYNSLDLVKKILKKGNMSSLREKYDEILYYVDRGESLEHNMPARYESLDAYKKELKDYFDIEYAYLFDETNNKWICTHGIKQQKEKFVSLETELKRHFLIKHTGNKFIAITINKRNSSKFNDLLYNVENFYPNSFERCYRYLEIPHNETTTFLWETNYTKEFESILNHLSKSDIDFSFVIHKQGETHYHGSMPVPHNLMNIVLNKAEFDCPSFTKSQCEKLKSFMYINFVSSKDFYKACSIFQNYKAAKNMIVEDDSNTLFWKNFSEEEQKNLMNVLLFFNKDKISQSYNENAIKAEYSILMQSEQSDKFLKAGEISLEEAYSKFSEFLQSHNYHSDLFSNIKEQENQEEGYSMSM